LGATFYYMLTGRTPFGDGTVAQKLLWHQSRQPKPVTEYRQDVPDDLAAVILKMMAKDPADRYQTPLDLADALEPFTRDPIAPPPDRERPPLRPAAPGTTSTPDPGDTPVGLKGAPSSPPPRALQGMTSPPPRSGPTPSPMPAASAPASPPPKSKPPASPTPA